MNKYLIISVKLSDLFPIGYQDKRYVELDPIRIGYHTITNETERPFKTVFSTWQQVRKIQTIIYDKYKIKLPLKQNDGLELALVPQELTMQQRDGSYVQMSIINSSVSSVEDSLNRFLEIEYADVRQANYKDYEQPIEDFLKSDKLISKGYLESQLYCMELISTIGASIKKYYTVLVPEKKAIEVLNKKENINGIDKSTRRVFTSAYILRFYVGELDAYYMEANLAYYFTDIGRALKLYRPSLSTLTAVESVTPEVKRIDSAVDLYEVNITFKYLSTEQNFYS